jgi:hypothetical protein
VTLFCSGGVPGTHSKGVGYKGRFGGGGGQRGGAPAAGGLLLRFLQLRMRRMTVRGNSNRREFGSRLHSPGRRKIVMFWSKSGDVWRSWTSGRVQWGAIEDGEDVRCTWGDGELARRTCGEE